MADPIITPIIAALGAELQTIPGVGRVYTAFPDGPPEDSSVLLPLTKFKFEGDTNGKIYVRLLFGVRFVVRRSKFGDNLQTCYNMFFPFAQTLSAISNQELGSNLSITVTPKDGSIAQFYEAGQAFVGLLLNTEVLTEFNILE